MFVYFFSSCLYVNLLIPLSFFPHQIFREPKKSSELDSVLSSYSRTIRRSHNATTGVTGALLLCVVGKMQLTMSNV